MSEPVEYCRNNHPLTVENVGTDKRGTRYCRTCKRSSSTESSRRQRARRRAEAALMPDTRWRDRAACVGVDPALFEPMSGAEKTKCHSFPMRLRRVHDATMVCYRCPVREACLQWAQTTEQQGVWGGRYMSRASRGKGAA